MNDDANLHLDFVKEDEIQIYEESDPVTTALAEESFSSIEKSTTTIRQKIHHQSRNDTLISTRNR
jgi:hypothetical protein